MNLLPRASGTRPRVACEIMPRGVIAACSAGTAEPLGSTARANLAEGALVPGLKSGNIVDRTAIVAAVRQVLEQVGERNANVSLVIPDSAVRVLLLDFESLPTRQTEALPLIRFRLKKLLPFDADDAMVSFQVMSTSNGTVRVLAIATPRDVLAEYESVVREAGFEPGAVLSSTLASLAAVDDTDPVLLVNANPIGVTAAITRAGVLLLHRSVDLQEHVVTTATPLAAELPQPVDFEAGSDFQPSFESAPDFAQNAPTRNGSQIEELEQRYSMEEFGSSHADLHPVPLSAEIAQAVSVAAAYFEDTLGSAPAQILSAGSLGADRLRQILIVSGVSDSEGLRVREVVDTAELSADAVSASTPRSWLSGVAGALRG